MSVPNIVLFLLSINNVIILGYILMQKEKLSILPIKNVALQRLSVVGFSRWKSG